MELTWLPEREGWSETLLTLPSLPLAQAAVATRQAATSRMDLAQAIKLDRIVTRIATGYGGELPGFERVRVALLGSSTTAHLSPALRVAGLRRGLLPEVLETPYGMYRQTLFDSGSVLAEFAPQAIVFSLDARHIAGLAAEGGASAALDAMQACWRHARERFGCQVIQQTLLPVFPAVLGQNEHRLPHAPAAIIAEVNARLREDAMAEGLDLLAVDSLASQHGLPALYETSLWHHSKHEIHPRAAALWGEHAARLLAAARGRSAKCLVLDLDNTLWGGVIGDDGMEGIVLGQGSARGEAYAEFQRYCKAVAARGILLAVCSKNEEANAREPFQHHPEMLLRCSDIACFVANWTDKAANLREIARRLRLGLDALVFVDDNPVERALIRRELPEVHVPEMPEDPAEFPATLAAAGYFEALGITTEDRARCAQYRVNAEREELRADATDMEGYLQSLDMVLTVAPVDAMSLARVTQLLNKTNQFNLLTRRLTPPQVAALARNRDVIALQARLTDRFGDNGIIAVLTASLRGDEATIDDWLMSCRVLGRCVEQACLQALVDACAERGMRRLVGEFRPTAKNALVRDLFASLGFAPLKSGYAGTSDSTLSEVSSRPERGARSGEIPVFTDVSREGASPNPSGNSTRWVLDLAGFQPRDLPITLHAAHGSPAHETPAEAVPA